jgi:hypothetical protein
MHKLDVGVFGEDGEVFAVEDVVIGENKAETYLKVDLPAEFKVQAVIVNLNEHAYIKVRFDQASIDWFMANLHLVKDRMMRGAIWRYFWLLVMDRKITSIQYMNFVQRQLG